MNIFNKYFDYLTDVGEGLPVLYRRRIVIAIVFGLLGVVITLLMTVVNWLSDMHTLSYVNAFMGAFFTIFIIEVKRGKHLDRVLRTGSGVFGVLILYLYFSDGFASKTYLWMYTYPIIAIALGGLKSGRIQFLVSYMLVIIGTAILWINGTYSYEPVVLIRFSLSLFVVFTISSYMEATSEQEHELLQRNFKALEIARKDLLELTIRDSLTGLFNRRYLDEVLPLAITQSRRYHDSVSVLMIDVDFFKKYNDYYGHQKGDEALQKVAQVLLDGIKRENDYVCRYGGEEFAVIMNKCNNEAVDSYARSVVAGFEKLNETHRFGIEERITVSIGTATSDLVDALDTKESLIKRADTALYAANRLGRNRYCKI